GQQRQDDEQGAENLPAAIRVLERLQRLIAAVHLFEWDELGGAEAVEARGCAGVDIGPMDGDARGDQRQGEQGQGGQSEQRLPAVLAPGQPDHTVTSCRLGVDRYARTRSSSATSRTVQSGWSIGVVVRTSRLACLPLWLSRTVSATPGMSSGSPWRPMSSLCA